MVGKLRFKFLIIWAVCILFAGCFLHSDVFVPRALPLPDAKHLQMGDWIFRSGTGGDSALIRRLSAGAYSHVGLVVQTEPEVWVVHAATDDDEQRPNQVLRTHLADFLSAQRADAAAVARPRFLTAMQREQTAHHAARQIGREFVLAPREQGGFYCTLLLTEAVAAQGVVLPVDWQYVDLAVFRGEYLFPQGLLGAELDWVYRAALQSE